MLKLDKLIKMAFTDFTWHLLLLLFSSNGNKTNKLSNSNMHNLNLLQDIFTLIICADLTQIMGKTNYELTVTDRRSFIQPLGPCPLSFKRLSLLIVVNKLCNKIWAIIKFQSQKNANIWNSAIYCHKLFYMYLSFKHGYSLKNWHEAINLIVTRCWSQLNFRKKHKHNFTKQRRCNKQQQTKPARYLPLFPSPCP